MKKLSTLIVLATAIAAGVHAAPMGTGFTYQGRLNDGGQPATGNYDMIFNLYDDPTNGTVLGSFSIFGAVPVTNGLFTVELNSYGEFGTNAFNGEARWLQIGARTNSNNAMNPWSNLSPRQPLNGTPQATFALNAGSAASASIAATVPDGAVTSAKLANGAVQAANIGAGALNWNAITGIPAGFADGVDNGATYSAGAGLNLSWLNQFSVDFGGSGTAASAAHSDHGHFGSAWGGNTSFGSGLSVTNGASNGSGLYGQQGTGSGFPYIFGNNAGVWGESSQGSGVWGASATSAGVRGISLGTNGYGVYGATLATNAANFGVYGQSASTSGAGVRGLATATTGTNTGVSGQSASISGLGVRGQATALSGTTSGVWGESASPVGTGVSGFATALEGGATGVYGQSAGIHGAGVTGRATYVNGFGPNYGVVGQSDSLWGYGVYGHAASLSGVNYGVVGQAHSPDGYGVVARNNSGVALKVEGTGTIQSDADSWYWVPGVAANLDWSDGVGTFYSTLMMFDNSVGSGSAEFPLTLPGVLFGQRTIIKSIEVVYHCYDGTQAYISGTELRESESPMVYSYTDTIAHKSDTKSSYAAPVNYTFNPGNAVFPTLVIRAKFIEDRSITIYGLKVRLGHK